MDLLVFRHNADHSFTPLTGAANPFDGVNVGNDAAPTGADMDGDGDIDFVVGNVDGEIRAFRNDNGIFTELTGAANPFDGVDVGKFAIPTFVDIDGDGYSDLAVADADSGGVRLFNNKPVVLVQVTAENDPPIVDLNGAAAGTSTTLGYTENDPTTRIATSAIVADPDSANLDGGRLTLSFTANGAAEDRLSIVQQGSASGQIGLLGASVRYGGVEIGTCSGGTDGSTPLVINLNVNADRPSVEALIRQIAYANVSDDPSTAAREVSYVLEDGDGGTPFASLATINVAAVNDAPTLAGFAPSVTFAENVVNATPQLLDADVAFNDVEGDFAGGVLKLSGLLSEDRAGNPQRGHRSRRDRRVGNGCVLWRNRHRHCRRRRRREPDGDLQRRRQLGRDRRLDPEPHLCRCQRHTDREPHPPTRHRRCRRRAHHPAFQCADRSRQSVRRRHQQWRFGARLRRPRQ